jgi:hypothetical protein
MACPTTRFLYTTHASRQDSAHAAGELPSLVRKGIHTDTAPSNAHPKCPLYIIIQRNQPPRPPFHTGLTAAVLFSSRIGEAPSPSTSAIKRRGLIDQRKAGFLPKPWRGVLALTHSVRCRCPSSTARPGDDNHHHPQPFFLTCSSAPAAFPSLSAEPPPPPAEAAEAGPTIFSPCAPRSTSTRSSGPPARPPRSATPSRAAARVVLLALEVAG